MLLLSTGTLYANPDPLLVSRQAAFPGLTRLADGTILAIFSIGQAFDAADMRAYVSSSTDNGQSWTEPKRLHQHEVTPEQSESFKPLALSDGTVLASGYVFIRPTPLTPIVAPSNNALLPLHNKLSRSNDGGRTWTRPERFIVEGQGLELSGPLMERASGEIMGAAAPFHLATSDHEGWIISSPDQGQSWCKKSVFFRSEKGNIAPWECRLIDFGGDAIGVLFWAHDIASGQNHTNHLALSHDNARTFQLIDTGIAGQASNGIALGPDEMLSIHAHRQSPVGLNVYRSHLSAAGLDVTDRLGLFDDEKLGQENAQSDPFANLRFGQPSLLPLGGEDFLACCWQVENCQHVIKTYRIRL